MDKVALITGAYQGIGFETAKQLGQYGFRPKTVAEGADTSVWLATLKEDGPTAGFFMDRQRINW